MPTPQLDTVRRGGNLEDAHGMPMSDSCRGKRAGAA